MENINKCILYGIKLILCLGLNLLQGMYFTVHLHKICGGESRKTSNRNKKEFV